MKDRRIKERRSFMWEEPYNFKGVAGGIKFKRPERRKTIIKAGRRNQESGTSNKVSFWRKAWLNKPEVPGIK